MLSGQDVVSTKSDHRHDGADVASVHGMLAMGTQQLLLSHLPMFHPPHDYQVILGAHLEPAHPGAVDPMQLYANDRRKGGGPLYTIVPQPLVLPMLADASDDEPHLFGASVVRGHFERGGITLASDARLVVTDVVHFRTLSAEEPRPEALTYILFGSRTETFAAHYITTRPDFDHVVRVQLEEGLVGAGSEALFDEDTLGRGVLVTIPQVPVDVPLPAGVVQARIPAEDELETLGLASQPQPAAAALTFEVIEEVYLERGDLAF